MLVDIQNFSLLKSRLVEIHRKEITVIDVFNSHKLSKKQQ